MQTKEKKNGKKKSIAISQDLCANFEKDSPIISQSAKSSTPGIWNQIRLGSATRWSTNKRAKMKLPMTIISI